MVSVAGASCPLLCYGVQHWICLLFLLCILPWWEFLSLKASWQSEFSAISSVHWHIYLSEMTQWLTGWLFPLEQGEGELLWATLPLSLPFTQWWLVQHCESGQGMLGNWAVGVEVFKHGCEGSFFFEVYIHSRDMIIAAVSGWRCPFLGTLCLP